MRTFECAKCGSKEIFIEEKGSQKGLYCADCGKWIKWLNKDDERLANRQIATTNPDNLVREEVKQEAILEARDIISDLKEVAEAENWVFELFIEEVIKEIHRQIKGGMYKND